MSIPQVGLLPDGRRLHMHHGPIDLIVAAFGDADEVAAAYEQAAARFATILDELVSELPALRRASGPVPRAFRGEVARIMEKAAARQSEVFVTPMAAVAGAVADTVLSALVAGRRIERAHVNNGGDIALHLEGGARTDIAIAGTGHGLRDRVTLTSESNVRGVATSGWKGRSHSLGIADAVTVLARTAAEADVAATLIANDVDLPGHGSIARMRACDLAPDSDLGARLVTTAVGALGADEVAAALERGARTAARLVKGRSIEAAALFLRGQSLTCGRPSGITDFPFHTGNETTRIFEETHG